MKLESKLGQECVFCDWLVLLLKDAQRNLFSSVAFFTIRAQFFCISPDFTFKILTNTFLFLSERLFCSHNPTICLLLSTTSHQVLKRCQTTLTLNNFICTFLQLDIYLTNKLYIYDKISHSTLTPVTSFHYSSRLQTEPRCYCPIKSLLWV